MTLLLPIPRAVAFHALRDATDRLRRFLVVLLTRKPAKARHRVLSPGQIRWRRWKSELADYVATGVVDLPTGSVPQPRTPVRDRRETSRTPAWGALDPPPRTAQSPDPLHPDDRRWIDEHAPASDCAMPNVPAHDPAEPEAWPGEWVGTAPGAAPEPWAREWSEAPAEPWSEVWTEPCAEPWTEPCAEPWAEPWGEPPSGPVAEPRGEHPDAFFAGHLPEPVHAGRSRFAHTLDRPGVTESPAAWPAFTERVFAHAAAEPATGPVEPVDATEVPDPGTDAETTVVEPLAWEFEVGDLARWWDEAVARLDAVARGEDPDRPW
ncbi:hypothetical protein IOD16_35210 [Saccharothrix sp. 6-C]|uniref:hypothetical protein n=1 Tax=Saccharothrix sp. 6-C TaxID=2781735 RepID=UPI001917506C|nr:hypothetical protein [Saccharothrix sp. 6-C]QQQ76216.1 hypothetical protein IOD16_35210 [Saccharothrix sp. 6-C]